MALPSAVTLGSAALVVVAGLGLAAWSAADERPGRDQGSARDSTTASTPKDSPGRSALPPTDTTGSPGPQSTGSPGPQSTGSPDPIADPPRDKPRATEPDGREPDLKPHKPKTDQASKPDKPKPDLVPAVLVEVYNNSGISGLAADKAAVLQGAGWNVAATDNWYGDIPESTVYYPDGLRTDAEKLTKTLGVERLQPAVSPMSFDRLTVIFTSG
ncbi:MAG: LytR C-terminal domain-containing protein [Actinomycetota bacterium]|nr:LytR C-terminal domain-containing protein [Nocardioidaceae bacterium]MDQ3480758.1 LytR C-terminal domain-containing protein [Actinomycetota bacterium]